jgi:hypothetical protein
LHAPGVLAAAGETTISARAPMSDNAAHQFTGTRSLLVA